MTMQSKRIYFWVDAVGDGSMTRIGGKVVDVLVVARANNGDQLTLTLPAREAERENLFGKRLTVTIEDPTEGE